MESSESSTFGGGQDAGAAPVQRGAGERFPCRECGAGMRWNPDAKALGCDYCGATRAVDASEQPIVERALAEAGDAARGLGLERRAVQCRTCGARITLDPEVTAESCAYCGSANVLMQDANRNALRPESLVPLEVGQGLVEQRFRRWIKTRWFRPNALKRTKRFDAVGVYVPFWTFDCDVRSRWTAQAGTYEPETMSAGRRRRGPNVEGRVSWRTASGTRSDHYDDYHVHASKGRSASLVRALGPFDTKGLVPYRPDYLAGWRAEEYQLDLEGAWTVAQRELRDDQRARCAADVPGDTHKDLRVHTEIDEPRWKHVLLPIWSVSYRFRGETYAVLVHGQTGRVVGKAPWSPVKIAFAALALGIVVAAYLVYG